MFWLAVLAANQVEVFMTIQHEYDTILFDVDDNNIATLTINRPDKLNALNEQVFIDLRHCLENLDASLRGLILTGQGEKAFIAGADIKAMSSMNNQQAAAFSKVGQDMTFMFESLPIPVISAVNGYALGGGCEIAMSGDFIYATDNAVFGLPEVTLGLIPGFGGTHRLAKLVGRHVARELIYTGRMVKIDEAKQRGLVLRSFPSKAELLDAAKSTLLQAEQNSGVAIAKAKKVMNDGVDLTLEQGFSLEQAAFGDVFDTEDMKEGTRAFLEKRQANFPGR